MCALTLGRGKKKRRRRTQDGARQQWPASSLRNLRLVVPKALPDTRGPQWPTTPRSTKAERETREIEPGTSPLCGGPLTLPLILPSLPPTLPEKKAR